MAQLPESLEDRIIVIENEITTKFNVTKNETDDGTKLQMSGTLNPSEMKNMYEMAIQELFDLRVEYEDLQISTQEYEQELEKDRDMIDGQLKETEKQKAVLVTKVAKLEEDRKQYKGEASEAEKELEKVQSELAKTIEKGKNNAKRVVSLEIENEELQNEARRRGYIIGDLELKFDTQLEEIELLQNELEEQKLHSEEQIERLKQQLVEISADLQVKEREVRFLKLKTIFESPSQKKGKKALDGNGEKSIADSDSKGGELHVAKSARILGRSQSRQEDDFDIDNSGRNRNSNIIKNEKSELLTDFKQNSTFDELKNAAKSSDQGRRQTDYRQRSGNKTRDQDDLLDDYEDVPYEQNSKNSNSQDGKDDDGKLSRHNRTDSKTSGVFEKADDILKNDNKGARQEEDLAIAMNQSPDKKVHAQNGEIQEQNQNKSGTGIVSQGDSHDQDQDSELQQDMLNVDSVTPLRSKTIEYQNVDAERQEEIDLLLRASQQKSSKLDQQSFSLANNQSKALNNTSNLNLNLEKASRTFTGQNIPTNQQRDQYSKQRAANKQKQFQLTANSMNFNEFDFNELLECADENIENSAFFSSSVQIMGLLDGAINAIDERLSKKKASIMLQQSSKNYSNNRMSNMQKQSHLQQYTSNNNSRYMTAAKA